MRILMFAQSRTAPSSRFRIFQWVPHLEQIGHTVRVFIPRPGNYWRPKYKNNRMLYWSKVYIARALRVLSLLPMLASAKRYDIIMMNRPLVPNRNIKWLESALRKRNPRIIFDFDDAIHLVGDGAGKEKIVRVIQQSAWVTPGNSFLAEFAKENNERVTIIPTVIDTEKFYPVSERQPGPLRIGWTGSRETTRLHLPMVYDVILELAREFDFELVVISNVEPDSIPGVDMKFIPWNDEEETAIHQLFDIGLMPLVNRPFERGKCGAKLLIYGSVGVPVVASPVGANVEIVQHGKTGFLAETSDEWLKYLRTLLQDAQLRYSMGLAGRRRIEDCYSIKANLPKLVNVFERVLDLDL